MKTSLLTITCLVLLLSAAPISAHELTAPSTVNADGAGHFSFPVVLEVTVATPNGSAYINGTDNTGLGEVHLDGFCIDELQPGFYPWIIEGNLADPGLGGTVIYDHSLCDSWSGSVTISITPPAVGLEQTTWSTIKAQYR